MKLWLMPESKRAQHVKRNFRQPLLLLHQYTGFIFAAYLIVICASGTALLLFENQISDYRDYLMIRVPIRQSKVSLAQMVRGVEQANPGKRVYHILESCNSGCTYDASMHDGANRLDALVDPYTGAVLRSVVWEQTPIGILYNLHGNLFYGDTGAEINGIAGLSVVVLGITGCCLWPGWQAIRRGFTIKLRSGAYRVSYDLHKIVGITAVAFLLMWSLTGAGQVLWPEPPEPLLSLQSGGAELSLDKLAQIGDSALSGQLTMVYLPANGTLVVRKRVPGDFDPYGYSYVVVDAHTGKVVQVYDARRLPLPWRVRAAMYAIHIGAPGGIILRLAYAVFGLAPALLFLTAFLMWLYKLRRNETLKTINSA
jgi:uncharacterized iron-regulated membrane protein